MMVMMHDGDDGDGDDKKRSMDSCVIRWEFVALTMISMVLVT